MTKASQASVPNVPTVIKWIYTKQYNFQNCVLLFVCHFMTVAISNYTSHTLHKLFPYFNDI